MPFGRRASGPAPYRAVGGCNGRRPLAGLLSDNIKYLNIKWVSQGLLLLALLHGLRPEAARAQTAIRLNRAETLTRRPPAKTLIRWPFTPRSMASTLLYIPPMVCVKCILVVRE